MLVTILILGKKKATKLDKSQPPPDFGKAPSVPGRPEVPEWWITIEPTYAPIRGRYI